ncbi:helix-turn-helix domain-containing protein [Streptococcus sanguinis]|uniref:Transcriptional regulation protein n=1 Tax=Streptococcus sanguinis SK115 TaxID=888810 RepID=F0IA41_STRSA|nr:cytoskeleton protein RodZ [Streptococcus sanguinis]EGD31346.1 hypothetical protein HMPREF9382_1755 [Streptococcus sanguinis SK115]MBZ2053799.1 helix-turn-helix domain-containing protein [Streptococcus sanguinis]MCY7011759.1 helix-turn-helix domain-containing protein [Streptococcus sanguinis]MCY7033440.1 helix-turn-helix domain-containing protein [Streptococcus sanguinis]
MKNRNKGKVRMRKKTIGEVLKLARTNQGLSLEELSKKTDIQQDLLEALERNDYDLLPSPFYARSFLRKYAWAVDLDESIILEAYEAGEMIVFDEVALAADEEFRSRKNKNKTSFLPLFYFLLLASAIAAFVAYYIWSYAHTNSVSFKASDNNYSLVSSTSTNSQKSSFSSADSKSVSSSAGQLKVSGSGDNLIAEYSGAGQSVKVTVSVEQTTNLVSISDSELAEGVTLSPEEKSSQTVSLEPGNKYLITLAPVKGATVTIEGQKLDTSALTSDSGTISLNITKG